MLASAYMAAPGRLSFTRLMCRCQQILMIPGMSKMHGVAGMLLRVSPVQGKF